MDISNVWKEKAEPLTWRHFVVAAFWAVTVIPMVILFCAAALADKGEQFFGQLRVWANPQTSNRFRVRS